MREWKMLMGPEEHILTEAQLRVLIANGQVRNSTPLFTTGLQGYSALRDLPEFWRLTLGYVPVEELPLAEIGTRMKAFAIDSLCFVVFMGSVFRLVGGHPFLDRHVDTMAMVSPAVFFYLLWATGFSPGKRVCRLRIVDAKSGRLPSQWQIVRRAIGALGFVSLNILYLLPAFISQRRQSFHDMLACTLVIDDVRAHD